MFELTSAAEMRENPINGYTPPPPKTPKLIKELSPKQQAIMDEMVIDKFCEHIGETIKMLHIISGHRLTITNNSIQMYFDCQTNQAIIVQKVADKKKYINQERYKKVNFSLYYNKVFEKFIAAGYSVNIYHSKHTRKSHYRTYIAW